jgi:hypothetical protein
MSIKAPYTRRDIPKIQPDILGRYHDLVMTNDLPGYEKLLDEYPTINEEERRELITDFKRDAETVLQRRWRLPK